MTGAEDDQEPLPGAPRLERRLQLEAGHARHLLIEDHARGPVVRKPLEKCPGRLTGVDVEPGERQHAPEGAADHRVVVHDEHPSVG